jgi:hypothetical protein
MIKLSPPALPDWLDHKLPFERYTAQVGHKKMHVMEYGEGHASSRDFKDPRGLAPLVNQIVGYRLVRIR